jgi:NAD(P)-dependent dehydrogenase (short-subunit alcohol dehydrogenase family)
MSEENLFDLTGKVALITGGGGLLAKQHAIALGTYGAKIYLADFRLDALNKVLRELKKWSFSSESIAFDVTSEQEWQEALRHIVDKESGIDILVNNAGYTNRTTPDNQSQPVENYPLNEWDDILRVNLTGCFLGCKVVGSQMLQAGKGSIINIASLYGVVSPNHRIYSGSPISQPIAYSVSKGGVIALTRYLGALWAERSVRVNCLTPGGVFDDHKDPFLSRFEKLNPIGKMLDKRDLQGGIVFLASDASSHVVGHNLIIDGGWTVW